jgi:hypothetical protein
MRIEASGTLTAKDYIRFSRCYILRKLWWMLLLMGLAGVNFIFVRFSGAETEDVSYFPLAVVLAIIAGAILWAPHKSAKQQLGERFKTGETVQFVFDADGVQSSRTAVASQIGWERIDRVDEMNSAFCLYLNKVSAVVVPKRFFGGPQEVEEWRKFAETLVPPDKWKKPWIGRFF